MTLLLACGRRAPAARRRDVKACGKTLSATSHEDFGFPLEPSQAIRIVGEGLRQHLQRHVPVELGVSGQGQFPLCCDQGPHPLRRHFRSQLQSRSVTHFREDAHGEQLVAPESTECTVGRTRSMTSLRAGAHSGEVP